MSEPTLREQFDADVAAVEAQWQAGLSALPGLLPAMERAVSEPTTHEEA